MAYNHLKDKVKSFLQPFAESGQAVGTDDIKKYFEQLRGDAEAMKDANTRAGAGGRGGDDEHDGGNNKKEQSGRW
jgi:E3 ubiquitin-protein ligase UBR7